jgi:hypothetical protein
MASRASLWPAERQVITMDRPHKDGWHRVVGWTICMERAETERGLTNVLRALPISTDTGSKIETSTMYSIPVLGEVWGRWKQGEVVEVVHGPKPQEVE